MTDQQLVVDLYIRVSTDRQAKEGDSLEEQESELKKFCDYRNFKIHQILIERGKSGGNTNRPEYKKLVADIEAKKIDAVVVKKLDRLSRSLLDFEHLMTSLQEKEVEFISLRENFDTTTAMGKAMLRIALVFAQLEREQTSERLKDVFSFRASQGLYNGGTLPYGYLSSNKELVPYSKEKQIIEIMVTQFLDSHSTTEVARYLNDLGHRTKSGKLWDKRSIQHILQNPLYIGYVKWGTTLHIGLHQPLISEKQFQEIQAVFKANRRVGKASTTGALLQKLLWCCCGHPMTPSHSLNRQRVRYYYYRCTSTQTSEKGKSTCLLKYVPMQATEILIMTSLTSLSKTILFQTIENKALKYNQGIELETQEIKSQITILQKQLDSLKHRQDMFLDSLVSGALSTVERKAITKRLEELEIEEKTIKKTISKTDFDLTQKRGEQIDWIGFKQILITFKEDFSEASQKEVLSFLSLHLTKITLYPDKILFHFKKLPWPVEVPKEIIQKNTS